MRTYLFRFPIYVITHRHTDAPPQKKAPSYRRRPVSIAPQGLYYNLDSGVRPRNDTYKKISQHKPEQSHFYYRGTNRPITKYQGNTVIPAQAGMTTKNNKVPLWRTRKRYCTKRTHRSRRHGPGFPLGCRGGTQCQGVVIPPCLNLNNVREIKSISCLCHSGA